MQSSELGKSLSFGSFSRKKTATKNPNLIIFNLKIDFCTYMFFKIWDMVYSVRFELGISDEIIRIQNFRFGSKVIMKTVEN